MMWWSRPKPIPDHRAPIIAALERELEAHRQRRRERYRDRTPTGIRIGFGRCSASHSARNSS
jgi:hypothetical protein